MHRLMSLALDIHRHASLGGTGELALLVNNLKSDPEFLKFIESFKFKSSCLPGILYSIYVLKKYDAYEIEGTLLAKLTEMLVDGEVAPGGPYRPPGTNLASNALLYNVSVLCLMSSYGVKLVPTEVYVRKNLGSTDRKSTTYQAANRMLESSMLETRLSSQLSENESNINCIRSVNKRANDLFQSVIEPARAALPGLPHAVKSVIGPIESRLLASSSSESILLLPFVLSEAFESKMSGSELTKLAVLNYWGWVVYTLYDDVLDTDDGINKVPVLMYMQRELQALTGILMPKDQAFKQVCTFLLNSMDIANDLEARRKLLSKGGRYFIDDYSKVNNLPEAANLADKSLGYAVTGLAILHLMGHHEHSRHHIVFMAFFRNFLAARQLSDDLIDWREDLRKGHVNYACQMIMRHISLEGKKGKDLYVEELMAMLNEVILKQAETEVRDLIGYLLEKAQAEIDHAHDLFKAEPLSALLEPLKKAAKTA